MCGIGGILSQKPLSAAECGAYCKTFSRTMAHRGPDDEGFALIRENGEVELFTGDHSLKNLNLPHIDSAQGEFMGALVHRRLSIIGLGPKGHQPMQSPSGRYWLCYNGEVFNFKELNSKYGFASETETDTETILRLLDNGGSHTLNELDGFYAGLLFDKEKNRLLLFRDPTAVKPLYQVKYHGKWLFASESKALRKITGYNSVSPIAIFHHLTEGVFGDGQQGNIFSSIVEIPPGIVFSCSGETGLEKIFDLQKQMHTPVHLKERLEKSVERRLISDVPLGFAVSGGLDSAAIIGLARKKMPADAPLKLFSIVSDDAHSDEREWQKQVADFNQAEWVTTQLENTGPDLLQEVAEKTDLPPVAWNNLAHFELCRMAKNNGVTVLFNGQGADEIFGGYPDYLMRDYWKLRKHLKQYAGNWPLSLEEIRKGWMKLKALQFSPAFLKQWRFEKENKALLHPDLHGHPSFLWSQAKLGADAKMNADYYGKKLWQMLLWEDRNGMAHSLESRNPFADDDALASFLKLPFNKKIANGYTKGILREAVKDVVPEKVLWRVDKKGFTVPDATLTWQNKQAWEPLFMSSKLDMWSPRNAREKLLKELTQENAFGLRWYFRLTALSAFLQNIHE